MRDVTLRPAMIGTALVLALMLAAAPPARAQHWNDSGPGRDLLSSTVTDFESFRQRTAPTPGVGTSGMAAPGIQQQSRAPIPILDWMPPPPVQQAPRSRPAPRRPSPPREAAMRAGPAPLPAAAPRVAPSADWDRSFSERERELERLRRILEEDRQRYDRSRQPQLQ